jgi:glycosyltransferase involved in cell wall biosynthesis
LEKLAIITTHPIQYNAPMFALLAVRAKVKIKVFYTWGKSVLKHKFDPGFGKNISWDIPLLEGYEFSFIQNIAVDPGSHHFKGIDNPTLIAEIKNWKADAILVYGWNFKSHLKCLRYFHKKIPVYFRGDSILSGQQHLKSMLRKIVLKWVYSHVDFAFYVGTENKKYFLEVGLKNSQLVFAPHAVDNQRFTDEIGYYEDEAAQWRKQLGILPGELVIVYAGKLESIKNLDWLINIVLKKRDLTIKLILVGNGPLEKKTERKNLKRPQIFVY